jgi:hypothetical protein
MKPPFQLFAPIALLLLFSTFVGCSFGPEPEVIYYPPPVTKQLQPETVYSRVTWGHEPHGVSPPLRVEKTPFFQPLFSFDLENVTLREAVDEIARTIGYRFVFSPVEGGSSETETAKTATVRVTGSVEEALQEVERQFGVKTVLNYDKREIAIRERSEISPRLP